MLTQESAVTARDASWRVRLLRFTRNLGSYAAIVLLLLAEPTLYVVYVSRRYLPLKIRAFVDFLIELSARTRVRELAVAR